MASSVVDAAHGCLLSTYWPFSGASEPAADDTAAVAAESYV